MLVGSKCTRLLSCAQATVVGFGEHGALLHVDVAAGDARPVTITAFVPLAELSWTRVRSAHDAVQVRKLESWVFRLADGQLGFRVWLRVSVRCMLDPKSGAPSTRSWCKRNGAPFVNLCTEQKL